MGCVFGLRRWAVALESDVVGRTRRKSVSVKKLSVRKRSFKDDGIKFVDSVYKLSSGLVKGECPFDHDLCSHVESCDDVLSLVSGFGCVEGGSCFRAVKVPK